MRDEPGAHPSLPGEAKFDPRLSWRARADAMRALSAPACPVFLRLRGAAWRRVGIWHLRVLTEINAQLFCERTISSGAKVILSRRTS
jgi:hypothetical protein